MERMKRFSWPTGQRDISEKRLIKERLLELRFFIAPIRSPGSLKKQCEGMD
jgi:hypothetical protein